MAAAYNVPLGGALFAAEVLLGSLTLSAVLPAFVASFTGIAVSWLLLPNVPAYNFPALDVSKSLIVWAVMVGPMMGVVSVGYVRAISWARSRKPQGWRVAAYPVLAFATLGWVAIKFPQILGNGKNIVQLTFFDQIGGWLALLADRSSPTCRCALSALGNSGRFVHANDDAGRTSGRWTGPGCGTTLEPAIRFRAMP